MAAVGAVMLVDQHILDAIQRNKTEAGDKWFDAVTHLGGAYGTDLTIALLLGGIVTKNQSLRDTGFDSLESSVWAAGVVTPVLKKGFGRYRPNEGHGTYDFEPFSSAESFPSGHSTNAWAIATAIAAHSDGWVVPTIAYTLASNVSIARLNSNVHFPSDVLAGALIGRAVAKSITTRHRAVRNISIMPSRNGVMVSMSLDLSSR